MSDRPVWRALYDRVSDELNPRLTEAMASDGVAEAIEIAGAIGSRATAEFQRTSERMLHVWNLPASTDVTILRQEVGALTRELRSLARRVDELQRQLDASSTDLIEEDPVATRAPQRRAVS